MIKNKLIIFDLDGTLYKFTNDSFVNSGLQKKVLANAKNYIQKKLKQDQAQAQKILREIQKEYGEDISIALEKKYNCSRRDYFNEVWDISAKGIITSNANIRNILLSLREENKLLLVSDGAMVWIINALRELNILDIFEKNILSGDGKKRKSLGNRFDNLSNQYGFLSRDVVVIGDQESTDIIPARNIGFKTIYINDKKSKYADVTIENIDNIAKGIEKVFS